MRTVYCFLWVFLSVAMVWPAIDHAEAAAIDSAYVDDDNCLDDISRPPTVADMALGQFGLITQSIPYPTADATMIHSYETITEGFQLEGFNISGTSTSSCNHRGESITFCYNPVLKWNREGDSASPSAGRNCDQGDNQHTLGRGEVRLIHGTWFRGATHGAHLCVDIFTLKGWRALGCREDQDSATAYMQSVAACYVARSCYDPSQYQSRALTPLTGPTVQCIKETLYGLFFGNHFECASMFSTFQRHLQGAITAALTLYVIFFGIRVTLGQEAPSQGEVFMFVVKIALVVFFTSQEGVVFLYDALIGAMTSLADMVFQVSPADFAAFEASTGKTYDKVRPIGVCTYDDADYATGYEYMALWDSVDCRMGYYLGMMNAGSVKPKLPMLFYFILPSIFMFQIVFIIVALITAVFLISVIISIVHTFIIAMVMLTIMVYMAPLFVPMALFEVTKKYFSKWQEMLLGFTLQPVVLFAFLAFVLVVFDRLYYGNCQFEIDTTRSEHPIFSTMENLRGFPIYRLTPASLSDSECTDSIGYQLYRLTTNDFRDIPAVFFDLLVWVNPVAIASMTDGFINILIFIFLFYFLTNIMSGMATDLVGGAQLGDMATGATKLFDMAAKAAGTAIAAATGVPVNAAMNAAKKGMDPGASARSDSVNRAAAEAPIEGGSDGGSGGSGGAPPSPPSSPSGGSTLPTGGSMPTPSPSGEGGSPRSATAPLPRGGGVGMPDLGPSAGPQPPQDGGTDTGGGGERD